MSVVVDTNVPMVASGLAYQADLKCVNESVQRLYAIMREGGLLLDDLGLILSEYTKQLGHRGRPGAGEKFVKWAFNNQCMPNAVRQTKITPRTNQGWRRFEEFPSQENLSTFDRSDQKFVAVAISSGERPSVLVAIDRGWWRVNVSS